MKLIKAKPKWLLVLIMAFYITSVWLEASSHNEDLRILIVGDKRHVRYSADILSGRKQSREIVKSAEITDQGCGMMVITGPDPCEKNTVKQTFIPALFLSSPGPHAVLIALSLEDQESEPCDIPKQLQDLLGSEVLQFCIIVLLLQQDPEKADSIVRTSRVRAGEMIDACGGRYHMITDTDSTPAQVKDLKAEIDKLVWLNGETFYSVLNNTQPMETEGQELLKTLQDTEKRFEAADQDANEENQLLSVICQTLGGPAGAVGWILLVSLTALVINSERSHRHLKFMAACAVLVTFLVTLRNILGPEVAIPLNLALCSSIVSVLTINKEPIREGITFCLLFIILPSQNKYNLLKVTSFISMTFILKYLVFLLALGPALGALTCIRSCSDVLRLCLTAPGVTVCNIILSYFILKRVYLICKFGPLVLLFGLFLCCMVGATLSFGLLSHLYNIIIT